MTWLDRAPMHFMIAMESMRCWMCASHGGADADGADDQRDQTHQAKKRGGAVQALRDDGMRLAIIGDQGVRECALQQLRGPVRCRANSATSRNRKRSAARLPGSISPVRSKPVSRRSSRADQR